MALRGQQLTLIEMSGGAGQDGLDLPERIAALERELRYYRRVIPVLARASASLSRPSCEHAGELTHLARWLTDGQRVMGSVSRILGEQPELEIRLEALERAHRQIRDEVVQLFDDEPAGHDADPGVTGGSWFRTRVWVRAGLVALILVIVAIASLPYVIDWR
ncbi:MAG TPA: hypothetical protein VJX71_16905 [Methylomirabilota bacterium]|nr:hypothetical protein [Methylomirabilota bacterium]